MRRTWARLLLTPVVVGVVAVVMGCTPNSTPTPTPAPTTAPALAQNIVLGAPALALDKLGVDLGTVDQDQQGVATFLVANRGDKPLRVGPVKLLVEQGCDAAIAPQETPEVMPGHMVLLPIKLGPHRELGPHRLLVKLESNDPAIPLATVAVRFVVAPAEPTSSGPRLRVDKEMIDAGIVPYDWPLYEQFTLRNDGDEPLVLVGTPQVRVEEGC